MVKSDIGGVWRTVGGRRIFIKDGQDLSSAMKESGKFESNKNNKKITHKEEAEYELYKKAKENPDSISPMTEMSTDWEDLDKRFKDRYEKDNQKWLTEKDSNWLKNQGHDTELEKKIKNFKPSGDIDNDERRLEDISSNYFYDEVGIYNENIDSTATKWAHDKAVELNDKNKQKKTAEYSELKEKAKDKYMPERTKAVSQYQNGEIDRNELMKRFDGNEERMKEAFEKMGYTAPTKENIDRANANARQRAEERKNTTKGAEATSQEKVLEEFKNSDGSKENFEKALNKISEMEYNNEINPDEYKEYISKIQKEYADKKKNNTSDLMTAEQLKGKNREEQKEINKQYLKEQNKLAKEKNDANFAKEWYEGTKKTENMAKENLERAKRNGTSVEDLSNRTRQVHELELETQKAQEHSNKMNAKANASNVNKTANYSQKELNDVYKKEDYTEVISNLKQSEINKMNEAAFDMNTTTPGTPGYNNAKEFIQKMENKAAAQFLDKQNKANNSNDVMNNNIRNAYQEYKKKHPGSKINFSKFKDNYKS